MKGNTEISIGHGGKGKRRLRGGLYDIQNVSQSDVGSSVILACGGGSDDRRRLFAWADGVVNMSFTELLQITFVLTVIAIYWWGLCMILIFYVSHYLGERILGKMDRKVTGQSIQGVY